MANIVFLPPYGIIGSSWALLVANCTMALATFILGQRIIALPQSLVKLLGVCTVAGLGLFFLNYVDASTEPILICILAKTAILLASALLALSLSGLSIKELFSMLRIVDRRKP